MSLAYDVSHGRPAAPVAPGTATDSAKTGSGRIPRITIEAFSETQTVAEVLENAAAERRMSRAILTVRRGGLKAAIKLYRNTPTPHLIILESRADFEALLSGLDALAQVCDTTTKVIVIGEANNIALYRELLKRGVSEYLYMPVEPMGLVSAIGDLFSESDAPKLGRVYGFIGAKGGVGSSSIAHNVAWTLARNSDAEVVLVDMDMAFGTASLNFALEPATGIADAVSDAERLDEQMLERLLVQCDDRLRLLAAPALIEAPGEVDGAAIEAVIEVAQRCVPHLVLDIPHLWTDWSRKALLAADEVVVTAAPDLANLKNAKYLVDLLEQIRPHDPAPRLVLNQVAMANRPEIKPAVFAEALGLEPVISLPFDAKGYGDATNRGRMVTEASRRSATVRAFRNLAESLSGRPLRRNRLFEGFGRALRLGKSLTGRG